MARLMKYAHAGVEPTLMGIAGTATRLTLQRASPSCRTPRPDRVQRGPCRQGMRGGEEAGPGPGEDESQRLRHLAGPSDRGHRALITTKAVHELQRTGGPLRAGDYVASAAAGGSPPSSSGYDTMCMPVHGAGRKCSLSTSLALLISQGAGSMRLFCPSFSNEVRQPSGKLRPYNQNRQHQQFKCDEGRCRPIDVRQGYALRCNTLHNEKQ